MRPSFEKSSWLRLLTALAGLKAAGAVVAFLAVGEPAVANAGGVKTVLPPSLLLVVMLVLAAVGGFLLVAGRKDLRASYLGLFFLLLSTVFSNRPLLAAVDHGPSLLAVLSLVLSNAAVDAFAPFFFWLFVREFPSGLFSVRSERWMAGAVRASLALGIFLFSRQLGLFALRGYGALSQGFEGLSQLLTEKPSYSFYVPYALAMVTAFVVLAIRARFAAGEERRRVQLFTAGLVLGLAPLFLQIVFDIAAKSPEPPDETWVGILFAFFLSAPVATAYAVVVHHVLNVQLVARRALQYALARYSAIGLATVPLLALVFYLHQHKEESLAEIFSGNHVLLLGTASVLGLSALRYRRRLLDSIDRRFFREQYDARQILTLLGERIRATRDVASLASLITKEIDLALHLESIVLMVFDPRSGMLVDPKSRSRRLDSSSLLAQRIANSSDPIVVDLELPSSALGKLPDTDRHWLVDSGFRLIVPILARDGSLLGIVGLGEKKSGLPFLTEDRQLLRAIASSAAWVLELEQGRGASSQGPRRSQTGGSRFDDLTPEELPFPPSEQAKECGTCGALYPSFTVLCTACSRRLEVSHVPYVMPGKFRFERRIGAGGMGVVYRGADLALGRSVAVKTMRRVSPEDAMRLRREARTAAAVSHPHLASIYGIETWQGTPMLIMELLEGGTLAQHIDHGKLQPRETIDLGIAMAEALGQLHNADILHRDIKPSNIGYSRDGVPKLMDFGIARLMLDLNSDLDTAPEPLRGPAALSHTEDSFGRPPSSLTTTRQLVGTLAYLSPEAINGHREDVSFDLWSLSIVLYECLLGRKIFTGSDPRQIMSKIRHGRVPDFSQVCQEHNAVLGDFFRAALHRNLSYRPASARELKERLLMAQARL